MYEELLIKAGLSKEQALVYQTLLKTGCMVASRVSQLSGVKRSLVYKLLEQLAALGLVEKKENIGAVTMFFPAHPSKIKELLAKKEEEIKTAEASLSGVMGKLVSDFNLLSGRPNVQFFEGIEGVQKVLDDSLTASEVIDAYSDIESIEKYIPEINKKYVEKRQKLKIQKRGLILDTLKARELLRGYYPDVTENRFVRCEMAPAQNQTILQIYDGKISYITLGENLSIGMIIENPHIYALHKYLYQCLWVTATPDSISRVPTTE